MQVILGKKDITEYINESSYSLNESDQFVEWEDGNYIKHSLKTRSKVKGSFEVVLGEFRKFSVADFVDVLEKNTQNSVTTMMVYVSNKGVPKVIDCIVKTKSTAHRQLSDGTYLDKLQIEVEEC